MTHKPSYYCVFTSHRPVITSMAALGRSILSHKEPFVSGQKNKKIKKNTLPAEQLVPELDGKHTMEKFSKHSTE